MSNKFSALILSLCLVIASGLFLTSCSDGGYVNPSSASETNKTSETTKTSDSGDSSDSGEDSGDETPEQVAEQKEQTVTAMEYQWEKSLKYYPELETSEYVAQYNAIRLAVSNATTTAQLRELLNDFNHLIDTLRENLTFDLKAYKDDSIQWATGYWEDALKKYPEAANNEDYAARYKAITDKLDKATTEEAVNSAMNELLALVREISAGDDKPDNPDTPGEELGKTKEAATKSLTEAWEQLAKIYPDLKTSEFARDYSDLLDEIENATTVEEINNLGNDISKLVERIYYSDLKVNVTEYKKAVRSTITAGWNNLLTQYPGLNDNATFRNRYDQILTQLETADTKFSIDEMAESFNGLADEIRAEYATRELQLYKQDRSNYIMSAWETFKTESGAVNFETHTEFLEFINTYNDILLAIQNAEDKNAVDAEVRKFKDLLDKVGVWVSKEETIQLWITDVTNYEQFFKEKYSDRITPDIESEINRLHEDAFINSKTAQEVLNNKDTLLKYLDDLEKKFTSQVDDEKLTARKQQSEASIIEVLEEVKKDYVYFEFDDSDYAPINKRIAEIKTEISNATTYDDLDKIDKKIKGDFASYAEDVLLKASISKVKQIVNDSWDRLSSGLTENKNLLAQLKDDVLYVVDFGKDAYDIKNLQAMAERFESVLSNGEGYPCYCDLAMFYIYRFPAPIRSAIEKKLNVGDLFDYIKSSSDYETDAGGFKTAADRFAEIKNAYESLKDMVYIKDASLNGEYVKLKLGATADDVIDAITSGIKIIGLYSDGHTAEISITSDMLNTNNVDLTKIGSYTVYINLNEATEKYLDLRVLVIIDPDMSAAEEIGTYAANGYYSSQTSGTKSIVLYNNGYLKLIWNDSETFYAYTDKGDYIEVDYGNGYGVSGVHIELFTLSKTADGNFFDYYRPEGEFIYEFNGWNAADLPAHIWVYGTYTGKGQYIAICSYSGYEIDENGRYLGFATYCTLDIENKKFAMVWAKTSEPDTVYTWDDNGSNSADLRIFLDDYKEEAREKIEKEWNELITAGYDVSYWEINYDYGKDRILNNIEMAMYRSAIETALSEWNILVGNVKSNYYTSVMLNFEYTSLRIKVGGDIEAFIRNNIVGQTISAHLYYNGNDDKIITITRDMITYSGTTEQIGYIYISISYSDKVYQMDIPGFQIEVYEEYIPEY